MHVASKVAEYFNTIEEAPYFDEASYFVFSRSCTVRVSGIWLDVWFDESYAITNSAQAN